MGGKHWNAEDQKTLFDNYPFCDRQTLLSLLPGRSAQSIQVKANKLGLTKTSEVRSSIKSGRNNGRWSGGLLEALCTNCGKTSFHKPNQYLKITNSEKKPFCSNECSIEHARTFIKYTETSIERKMADELTARFIDFIPQYSLNNKFSLDFFLPEYNVSIECDGDYWHRLPRTIGIDKAKNAYVKACGVRMFRFWESEINNCVEACVDIVMTEINVKEAI